MMAEECLLDGVLDSLEDIGYLSKLKNCYRQHAYNCKSNSCATEDLITCPAP